MWKAHTALRAVHFLNSLILGSEVPVPCSPFPVPCAKCHVEVQPGRGSCFLFPFLNSQFRISGALRLVLNFWFSFLDSHFQSCNVEFALPDFQFIIPDIHRMIWMIHRMNWMIHDPDEPEELYDLDDPPDDLDEPDEPNAIWMNHQMIQMIHWMNSE